MVATRAQQLQVLRAIASAEAHLLPPGWDADLEETAMKDPIVNAITHRINRSAVQHSRQIAKGFAEQRESEGTRSARQLLQDTTRSQMPSPYLLDTSEPAHKLPPKLRLIKPAHAAAECGFGTCAITPACTGQCRHQQAERALAGHYGNRHTQREAMPEPPLKRDLRRPAALTLLAWLAACAAVVAWVAFR